ncbi:MAG: biopolymer transporter ExbB [Azospira oryzae]|jgi:biopolymer transport protein ExbB|nr:biopolymer transporter ExbB [Cytophaga sp.]PZR30163.1 MAG: biopolymer transporter ExbB [Azospira oryzae]
MLLFQIVEPIAEEAAAAPDLSIGELLMKGGWVMVPLFILSVFTLYIVVERLLYLKTATQRKANFIPDVRRALQDADIKSARLIAQQEPSATGKMVLSALDYIGKPFREVESIMETASEIELAKMERNIAYLGIIAGVAPMLGFIGTISGIIKIFYSISLADNISIGIIAGGLYEKMITSGAGLVVGVIAYVCYHMLEQKIQRYTLHLQEDALDFLKALTGSSK